MTGRINDMNLGYFPHVRAKFFKESFRIAINDNPMHALLD